MGIARDICVKLGFNDARFEVKKATGKYYAPGMEFEIFVKHEWLYEAGGQAELVLGDDPTFPYFSVFYKNGEFSHVRIYLQRNLNHVSYGVLRNPRAYDDRFTDEFKVEF